MTSNDNVDIYDQIYGPFELARRIDKSVDIVTDLTDVVQEELPKKALQGVNDEATNTAILDALDHVHVDLTPIEEQLDVIEDKIDHIDIDTSDLAKEDNATANKEEIINTIENELESSTTSILEAIADINITPISDEHIDSLFPEEEINEDL